MNNNCIYIFKKGKFKNHICNSLAKFNNFCSKHKINDTFDISETSHKDDIYCDNFKHQLYHHDFKIFSWLNTHHVSKSTTFKNMMLKKNIMIGNIENNNLNFSIIYKNNKRKIIKSHRLIYFVYNINIITSCKICNKNPCIFDLFNKDHIDHIDGNHNNNTPNNLQRLCSSCHSKKTYEQTKNNRISIKIKRSKKIICHTFMKKNIQYFDSITYASKYLQIDASSICKNIKNNKNQIIKWISSKKHNIKYRFEEIFEIENIENEVWKDLIDLDGKVSNKGRIKNNSGISYGNYKDGYYSITLKKNNYKVHRLIAKTFKYEELELKAQKIKDDINLYPECINLSIEEIINSVNKKYSIVVDHIDGNKLNNNLDNLRWCTLIENSENQKSVRTIEQWSFDKKILINTFKSQMEAHRCTKVCNKQISDVCNNKKSHAGGFFWKFKKS